MAAARKIKRSRKRQSSSFLPVTVQAFIARRLVDSVALILIGASAFLLTCLLTYNSQDPSWNTAADESVKVLNYGSWLGAWVSDILLQTIGGASFVLAFGIGIWGLRVFRREVLSPFMLRFSSLLLATIFSAASMAIIPSGGWSVHPYLGSSAGALVHNAVASGLNYFYIPQVNFVTACLTGCFAAALFFFAAAVTRVEVAAFTFKIQVIAYSVLAFVVGSAQSFLDWIRHYNDSAYEGTPVQLGIREKLAALREQRDIAREEQRALREARLAEQEDDEEYEVYNDGLLDEYEEECEEDTEEEYEAEAYVEEDESDYQPRVAAQSLKSSKNAAKNQRATSKRDTAQQKLKLSDSDSEWELPPVSLIQDPKVANTIQKLDKLSLQRNAELLLNVLADYGVKGEIVNISQGPVVTLYELEPAPGTKTSRVVSLSDDIARSMSAVSVRCAVVPGRNVIGIELPNKERQTVYMKEMLTSREFDENKAKLPLVLGKDIGGTEIIADLAKMPHLLVAGTTGSGKSVAVNTMIMSLLYRLSPEQCRFIMIDPKMLELSVYDGIPHLLSPVVTEPGKAVVALKWAVMEMEKRYRNMSKLGVRNIEGYNQRICEALEKGEEILHKVQTGFDPDTGKAVFEDHALELVEIPYIVVIVDEFADLMLVAGKDVENAIQRLAQMARAAGIHLIMATQRPSVDVITGVIKANFPTRISFQVTSKIDSRTILGESGAEQLLGMGDMLYMAPGGKIIRVHGPFVHDNDVEKTTSFLKSQAAPDYIDSITQMDDFGGSDVMNAMFGGGESGGDMVDELYDKAVAVIAREGKVSTSFIQRHLQIGYNRAARIVEEMERQGVISPASSTGKREILIRDFSDV